jgi:hypothetical protein
LGVVVVAAAVVALTAVGVVILAEAVAVAALEEEEAADRRPIMVGEALAGAEVLRRRALAVGVVLVEVEVGVVHLATAPPGSTVLRDRSNACVDLTCASVCESHFRVGRTRRIHRDSHTHPTVATKAPIPS